MTPLAEAASKEVVELHKLLVELFTGRLRDFRRFEKVFAADFEMVTPEGKRLIRPQILAGLKKGQADDGFFSIAIHDVRAIWQDATSVLLQYVEQQYREGKTTRRLSTALFEAASEAPCGVKWRYLQETWMDEN
jgi:hypothetical protein